MSPLPDQSRIPGRPVEGLESAPRGIMYSAVGRQYIVEAIESARSSLRHNAVAHLLFSSEEVPESEIPEGLSVVRFDPISSYPWVDRIANMRRSPFERTIYLDTDTYVVDEIAHVLELFEHYDVAAAFSPGHRGLKDPEVPLAFCECNCGVIAWRSTERVADFMRDWEETHVAWLEEDVLEGLPGNREHPSRTYPGDQPAFRRCAWQHGMHLYVLPHEYNLRLGFLTTVVGKVRVIHGRFGDYERLEAHMNSKRVPRTFPTPRPVKRMRRKVAQRLRRSLQTRSLAPLRRGS
jgi:hypothetical protein